MKVPEPRLLPSGKYFIQLRLDGESIPITRDTYTECKTEAELTKAQHRRDMQRQQKILSKTQEKKSPTIGDYMDRFIASRRKTLSPATINGYQCIRNTRFQNYINKKPSAIKDWQAVIDDEIDAGISAKTIRNAWGLLAASLNYAKKPVPDIILPKIIPSQKQWLDTDQIKVFVKAVKGHPCEIPALLALHSLRRSEILGLTWEKIDLDKNLIHIEGSAVIGDGNKLVYKETNKTKKSRRTVPIMIPALKDALNAVPEEQRTGLLYTKNPTLIWEQVNRICEKNGLPKVGVHGLRHSFAALAFSSEVGMTEREVMEIGGWEDFQTVHKVYEHLSDKNRKEAERKFSAFFQNANDKMLTAEKAQ